MWSNVAAHPSPGRGLGQEADPDHFRGIAGEGEVTQQPPPRAVGGGVEGPGRAGPRDPQPQAIAVHLEGVAVVRGSPGHDRDRGGPQLRRVLEAELGPLPLGRVQQQDPRVVHAAELHADLHREREVARRGQAHQPAGIGNLPGISPGGIDEQVGSRRAGQRQHTVPDPAARRRAARGLERERQARQLQRGHPGSLPRLAICMSEPAVRLRPCLITSACKCRTSSSRSISTCAPSPRSRCTRRCASPPARPSWSAWPARRHSRVLAGPAHRHRDQGTARGLPGTRPRRGGRGARGRRGGRGGSAARPARVAGVSPGYYAVFLRDPDGHNVEAVHHG